MVRWRLWRGGVFGLRMKSAVQDLEQRYNKLRVEVQMAQDADEPVTLEEVVRRVMRKEKQAAAAFPGTRASKSASKAAPVIPGVRPPPSGRTVRWFTGLLNIFLCHSYALAGYGKASIKSVRLLQPVG